LAGEFRTTYFFVEWPTSLRLIRRYFKLGVVEMRQRVKKRAGLVHTGSGWGYISAIGISYFLVAAGARAQIEITELMPSPAGTDRRWEWIEVRNTTDSAVNLDGWVFDDDDDPHLATANIDQTFGNTIVPSRGVAVLYAGDELDFTSQRFQDAWPNEITLIPLNGLTSLTPADTIGLWASREAYLADAIAMATSSPRRVFDHAVTSLAYTEENGFPTASTGHSIAWNGEGSAADGARWVQSEEQMLGAVVSAETTIASAAINSASDLGNPGNVPVGLAATGLLITEVMFNPASPAATVGWSEADFEWVEVYNNSGAPINFATTPYVFDDFVGDLDGANMLSGTLTPGEVGVLYNGDALSESDMETMWGSGINYIPVVDWPSLNNSGDTIALWSNSLDYHAEQIDDDNHRGTSLAAAALTYDTRASEDWPTSNNQSSIYRNDLSGDPNDGMSWTRSGSDDDLLGSRNATEILQTIVDNPGGDVGSPGFVPGSTAPVVEGDFNQNGTVENADLTLLLNNWAHPATPVPNGWVGHPQPTDPAIDNDELTALLNNWGKSLGTGTGSTIPEPRGVALLLVGLASIGCKRRRDRPA
jgi:Lamin Tail Domain